MRHPALPDNEPVETNDSAFHSVWQLRGWEECAAPLDEKSSSQEQAADLDPGPAEPAMATDSDEVIESVAPEPPPKPARASRKRKTASPDESAPSGDTEE